MVLGLRLILAVAVIQFMAPGAAAQTEGRVPGDTLGTASDSDLWRAIRGGENGLVRTPDMRPEPVLTAPFRDCALTARCTESVVGFIMPIHANFPAIREPQGNRVSRGALILLAVVFGGGLIGGAVFVYFLGGEGAGETPAKS
jgi:hypothetical protein